MNIAFIGLGIMGYPMAGHQRHAGHDVCVYNRTTNKAEQWVADYGGRFALTPREASKGADCVMLCVGNDDDVRSVVYGDDGVLSGLGAGATLVDHTTTSQPLAVELASSCQAQGIGFLDAPVSGGQSGAEQGELAIMLGGDASVLERVKPALGPYAKQMTLVGPTGAGQTAKMVNQILIAGVLQGIAEGFTLAKASDLDLPKVIAAISDGAAGSWQLSHRGLNIHNDHFAYGFALDWMVKDLGFCLESAQALDLTLPNTEYVNEQYKHLQSLGYNRSDTSVLIKQFKV